MPITSHPVGGRNVSRQEVTYKSYLLRLWRENPQAAWRASLQSTATEKVYQFARAQQMWAFLKAQMGLDPDNRTSSGVRPGESG